MASSSRVVSFRVWWHVSRGSPVARCGFEFGMPLQLMPFTLPCLLASGDILWQHGVSESAVVQLQGVAGGSNFASLCGLFRIALSTLRSPRAWWRPLAAQLHGVAGGPLRFQNPTCRNYLFRPCSVCPAQHITPKRHAVSATPPRIGWASSDGSVLPRTQQCRCG